MYEAAEAAKSAFTPLFGNCHKTTENFQHICLKMLQLGYKKKKLLKKFLRRGIIDSRMRKYHPDTNNFLYFQKEENPK